MLFYKDHMMVCVFTVVWARIISECIVLWWTSSSH